MDAILYEYPDFSATVFKFYDPHTFKENPCIIIPADFKRALCKLHLEYMMDDFVNMALESDNDHPRVCTLICFHQVVESTDTTCPPTETNWMFVTIGPNTAKFTMRHDYHCEYTKYGKEPYTDLQTFFVNEIYRPMQVQCNDDCRRTTSGLEEGMDVYAEKILEKLDKSNISPEKQVNIFELSATQVFEQNTLQLYQKQEEDLESVEVSTDDQDNWWAFLSEHMYTVTLYIPKVLGVEAYYRAKDKEWMYSGFSCICSKHELYEFIQKKTITESVPAPGYVVDKTVAYLHETYSCLGIYGRIVQHNKTSGMIDLLPAQVLAVFEVRDPLQ